MNPIINILQGIPESIRRLLLIAYAIAVLIVGALAICEVDTGHATDVLTYLGGYLVVQSAANVGVDPDRGELPDNPYEYDDAEIDPEGILDETHDASDETGHVR